jgi:hypothetical protein
MKSWVLGAAAVLSLWAVVSCKKSQCQGAERCACYANETCNDGLECRSNTCVDLDGSSGGSSGSGIDTEACKACAEQSCEAEHDACAESSGCEDIIDCMLECGSDANCLAGCNKGASTDANSKSLAYQSCAFSQCVSDCVYDGPSGSGGSSGGGASAGGAAQGGSASKAGSSSGGGSGGSAPSELVSGTNWLTLVADAAPADMGINGKLGIDGVFYAYADPCATATMQWDAVSRCVSGELCFSENGVNWGVAIGFDFNSVSEVKHAWSATAVAVQGLAWRVTSLFPVPLQVWVQNMDPSFAGTCSTTSCSINGPPDGTSSASSTGQFLFSEMVKDNWGGTGISYAFDPTNISSLQFKIPPATDSLSTSYSVCVAQLGVIR